MNSEIEYLINSAVLKIIKNSGSSEKLEKLKSKHDVKIHFIPQKYRILGGILQSMNIQFGNFIEVLMSLIIANDGRYQILSEYSGEKSNSFTLSAANDALIDSYISECQYSNIDIKTEFPLLLQKIVSDTDTNLNSFKHDIDLLFKDKSTNKIYYLEIKYNDDHDTGKFVDINRKFIKTYAYLSRELKIAQYDDLVPIIFFFTNKKLKGNIYIPEPENIKRGETFFNEFLTVKYSDVDSYMSALSESPENIKFFDDLYKTIMQL
ncbi:MAG: hypothetical protein RR198_06580 [Oscillospiraceae bacterium]